VSLPLHYTGCLCVHSHRANLGIWPKLNWCAVCSRHCCLNCLCKQRPAQLALSSGIKYGHRTTAAKPYQLSLLMPHRRSLRRQLLSHQGVANTIT
jgi:hypothetical protein